MKSNKVPLTDAKIKNLKPRQDKQYEIWDEKISGFGCRVSPKGSRSFVLVYRLNGRSRRFTLGPYSSLSLSEARKLAQKAKSDIIQGIDPAEKKKTKKAKTYNFETVVNNFIELYAKPRNKSWSETQRLLNTDFTKHWRNKDIREITKSDVNKILDKKAKHTPSAANHAFRAINKMFNWCVERDILTTSPCQGLSLPCPLVKRDRVLNDHELFKIWNAAEDMSYPYGKLIQILMLTGQRRGEVSSMRWEDLNFEEGIWIIPADLNKTANEHILPLTEGVIKIISSIPKTNDTLLFPARGLNKPISGYSKRKKKLTKNSDTSDWTVHDIRRTVATGMAKLKIPPHIIEKVLNHSTGSLGGVAGIYNKYEYLDEMREALSLWDIHLSKVIKQS